MIRRFFKDMALIAVIMGGHPRHLGHGWLWLLDVPKIDNAFRCPTRDQLVDQHHVARGTLVDSWGTSITFHCSPGSDLFVSFVRSAGPDKVFHTADDITND